jgi:superfamily II DNA or RNA helicase
MKTTVSFDELYNLVKSGAKPKVFTKTGWELVTDVYKKNTPGLRIEFNDGSILTGSNKHLILDDSNEWRSLDSLSIDEEISSKIVSRINSINSSDWIDFTVDAEHQSYILSGLTHHNSGKSLIISSIVKFYHDNKDGTILIICPTTSLVEQLYSDTLDYFPYWEGIKDNIYKIYSGAKNTKEISDCRIIISTWQSIYDNPESWFRDIEVVIGDETHLYSAKEVSKLFDKCVNASRRYGFTGTLSGEKLHQLQVEGIFGKAYALTTTSKLIENSQLSNFKISALMLEYSEDCKKKSKGFNWEDEVSFLISNNERNDFIAKLASSLTGNTLVLFSRVETHGKIIFDKISELTKRPVYFIYGGTETQIREDIRKYIDSVDNAIIVASSQIFSTGINIPSLKNIIFTHPSKSRIRTLQSIGRVLRLSKSKTGNSRLYDIVDNLCYKSHKNFAYKHFLERLKIYNSEKFNYKIIDIKLENLNGNI